MRILLNFCGFLENIKVGIIYAVSKSNPTERFFVKFSISFFCSKIVETETICKKPVLASQLDSIHQVITWSKLFTTTIHCYANW